MDGDPSTPAAKVPRSAEDDYAPAIVAERLRLCERLAGRPLPHLAGAPVPPAEARGNIENPIGFVQVPVGLAGPLAIDGSAGERTVYVPMATNEGAMVASYSRGMKALAAGGAVRARVLKEGLTQAPILVYADVAAAQVAAREADGSLEAWRATVAGITRHGALAEVRTHVLGRRLVLALTFTTGDAIGINMAARATDLIAADLAARTGARERYVHGEDVEKRANARALLDGRGRTVVADARVPREALRRILRVEPEDLVRIQRSYAVGFAHLGTHNHLVQVANGLAAVLLACGQDVAYVAESAVGLLDFDVDERGDLQASATLPALLVGTVGGGSGKGTAAECLDILGVRGDGGANTFAEMLAATVLAGDLSLMASFCTHEFVAAHEALGRNRPDAEREA
ncbi:MAG: 3-hydroxy-3-methylglutaryl-CoA reductase [Planctomycetota bacterium]